MKLLQEQYDISLTDDEIFNLCRGLKAAMKNDEYGDCTQAEYYPLYHSLTKIIEGILHDDNDMQLSMGMFIEERQVVDKTCDCECKQAKTKEEIYNSKDRCNSDATICVHRKFIEDKINKKDKPICMRGICQENTYYCAGQD